MNLEIRKNFFTVRTISSWNAIPDNVKDQKTINLFKNAYDKWKEEDDHQNNGVRSEIIGNTAT